MFRQSLVRLSNPSRTLATHAATAVRPQPKEPTFVPERWKRSEVKEIFNSPLLDLVFRSASVHRQHHDPSKIQLCTLLNIKSEFQIQISRPIHPHD
jgi:biotin synthase